jgi:hypothetical protein
VVVDVTEMADDPGRTHYHDGLTFARLQHRTHYHDCDDPHGLTIARLQHLLERCGVDTPEFSGAGHVTSDVLAERLWPLLRGSDETG